MINITKQKLNKISDKVNKLFEKTDKIKNIPIELLCVDEEYKSLYTQEPEKVSRIAENMKENGFDKSQPIIVLPNNTIIDGHSRYLAAKQAGLKSVPVIYKDISERTDVLTYMEHLQLDRRNLTDAEKVQHYENLMKLKAKAKAEGKSVENFSDDTVAKQLNISPRQVQKIREVENKANIEQLEALKKGTSTINQVHTEIKATEKSVKAERQAPEQKSGNDAKKSPKTDFEISENTNENFFKIAKQTKEFIKQLALYAKLKGNENQAVLLEKFSSADVSAKEIIVVWKSIIEALEKFPKQ